MGGMGFFGAAGLSVERVSAALDRLQTALPSSVSWGSNLIHSPNEPQLESAIAFNADELIFDASSAEPNVPARVNSEHGVAPLKSAGS